MLTQYTLKMPHGVYSGRGTLDHMKEIVGECATKMTAFSNQGIIGADLLEGPSSLMKEAGAGYSVPDGLPTEPGCDQAQAVINRFKTEKSDSIVAVGRGSIMDIVKPAFVLVTDIYTVRGLLGDPGPVGRCVPTLMISTTAGIGSKATPDSIVAAPERGLKVGIVNDAMIADYVILDEGMTRHLPGKITVAMGVNVLAHGIECYAPNKANPFSDTSALEALDLIFNYIEKARDDPDALDAKNTMLTAAFCAGAAITAPEIATVHTLSCPLGGKYHVPHGASSVMLLTPVTKLSGPAYRECLTVVYDRAVKGERESGLPPEEKSAWIIRCLDKIAKHLKIPNSLKRYRIENRDLDVLVEVGIDVKRLLVNNMREVTVEDARKLYLEIMR